MVELSPQACEHLSNFLESWHPNQRRLLFATRNGAPWDQNLLLRRKFRPLLRAIGIQIPRGNGFHAFRYANATLMSSFGASQELRQQRLGHADGSPVTETIYTHVISEDGKRIAAQLGNAVWGILDASWTEKGNSRLLGRKKAGILDSGLVDREMVAGACNHPNWYAAHVRQLGGVSPLHNLIEVK